MRSTVLLMALIFGAALSSRGDILLWPSANSGWTPITTNGVPVTDPLNDVSPASTDIVGSTNFPAAFWTYQTGGTDSLADDELLFRLRVEDLSNNPQFVWQVMLDTDTDHTDVDFALQLVLSGGSMVSLNTATTGGPNWNSIVLNSTPLWSGSAAGFSRFVNPTGDGSNFGGDTDRWVDFGIPWTNFAAATGLTPDDPFRMGVSSSTSHSGINKDSPGSGGTIISGLSDELVPATVPEPATAALLVLGGLAVWRRARTRGASRVTRV